MTITLKLFASLADRLPAPARAGHRLDLDVAPGATVLDVIRRQGIPETLCAIVLLDGVWVGRPDRATRTLAEGEVLSIWPPVAGGSAGAPGDDQGRDTLREDGGKVTRPLVALHRKLEMSISREEFFRLLPAALGSFELDRVSDTIHGAVRERRWTIRLVPLSDQRLGHVGVPRHRVEITLDDCPEPEGEAFMECFRRGFLRGGG